MTLELGIREQEAEALRDSGVLQLMISILSITLRVDEGFRGLGV